MAQGNTGAKDRRRVIVRTSVIGIVVNALLAGFKAFVGFAANSLSITMDAVNNLSDALSSVITILGASIAGRPADKKHPLGYGRVENLTAIIISLIVLYAGISSFVEAVRTIIASFTEPVQPDYSAASLIIVGTGILVKVALGRFFSATGKRVNSDSLTASGKDALSDAIISTATLVAAIIYITAHISLEAWLAAIISIFIIKSGFELLRDTVSQLLGERPDPELAQAIKRTICDSEDVGGAYDLILNNYGPDTSVASVHIALPESYTADRIDQLTRDIQQRVYQEHGVILTGVSVYAINSPDSEAGKLRARLYEVISRHEDVLQTHGFHVDFDKKRISCDIIIDFSVKNRHAERDEIECELRDAFPDFDVALNLDTDLSD